MVKRGNNFWGRSQIKGHWKRRVNIYSISKPRWQMGNGYARKCHRLNALSECVHAIPFLIWQFYEGEKSEKHLCILSSLSRPESIFAHVTGKGVSFEMICLDVVFNVISMIFFSTNFARISPLWSRWSLFLTLTLFHHCYDLCIKSMQILNRYCPFLTWLRYGLFFIWVQTILSRQWIWPFPLKVRFGVMLLIFGSIISSLTTCCPVGPLNFSSSAMSFWDLFAGIMEIDFKAEFWFTSLPLSSWPCSIQMRLQTIYTPWNSNWFDIHKSH